MNKRHDPSEMLTERQRRLLLELIKTPDIQSAARAAGIGRTTAYRWLSQPTFRSALTLQRNTALSEALNSIKSQTTRAAQELIALLETKDERLRWRICSEILRNSIKVRELEEIEERLALLEQQLNESNRRSS